LITIAISMAGEGAGIWLLFWE